MRMAPTTQDAFCTRGRICTALLVDEWHILCGAGANWQQGQLPSRARPAAQKAKVSDQDLSRGDEVSDGGHPSPVRGQLTIAGPPPPTTTTKENSSSSTSRTDRSMQYAPC